MKKIIIYIYLFLIGCLFACFSQSISVPRKAEYLIYSPDSTVLITFTNYVIYNAVDADTLAMFQTTSKQIPLPVPVSVWNALATDEKQFLQGLNAILKRE